MKILLANPPAYMDNSNRHFIQSGSRWSFSIYVSKNFKEHYLPYPFSMGYSLALLKQLEDVSAEGLDACALDLNSREFIQQVVSRRPDIFVIDVPTISFPLVMPLLEEIKQATGCKIVLTGGHVTALAEDILRDNKQVDCCLLGEYEMSLRQFVLSETGEGVSAQQDGIAYRENGGITRRPAELRTFNLDNLPYPDREDYPVGLYHDFEVGGRPCVQMLTSLGCPYKCSFCMPVRVMYGDSQFYRKRAPANIVAEMAFVKEKYHAGQVYFDDDTFSVDKQRLRTLCEELAKFDLDLPWTAMGDITIDQRTLEIMANAGCIGLKFGVESANGSTLEAIRKTWVTVDKVKRFVKSCRELGIWAHATFIIGLPGDRREDIEKTIKFSKELDIDSVQFSIATPFPGTPFYEQARHEGWLVSDDWTLYDGANFSVLSYPWLSKEEIEELHRRALKEWYRHALFKEMRRPRRILKVAKAHSLRYSTRKIISHLQGTL